jgi:hypothetical protein
MTIKRLTKADLPQSLGAFKPVGHVLMAFRNEPDARAAYEALRRAGFSDEDVLDFTGPEYATRMQQMLDHASEFAGFGYEIVLMRRYKLLCSDGCLWFLVYTPDDASTQRVADVAKRFNALTAVKYHRLVEEDLL